MKRGVFVRISTISSLYAASDFAISLASSCQPTPPYVLWNLDADTLLYLIRYAARESVLYFARRLLRDVEPSGEAVALIFTDMSVFSASACLIDSIRKFKIYLTLFAAAALAMTSCSKNEVIDTPAQQAIEFGTYTANAAQTKAAVMDEAALKTAGFGVFAFYTAGNDYTAANTPNFMYNQEVKWDDTKQWHYSPLKYWPNNPGDKVSFFAYAPFTAGKTWDANGTIAFTVNTDITKQEDLVVAPGVMNQEKQNLTSKIDFKFQHALSRIGFKVAYAADQVNNGGTLGTETEITLNSIKIESFYSTGVLDMNKTLAIDAWTGSSSQDFTLENTLLQNTKVTGTFTQVNTDNAYLMVIPQVSATHKITVKYTVVTTDSNDNTNKNNSTIVNTINKDVTIAFEPTKAYTFNLLLGMNSVDITATYNGWNEQTEQQVDLPLNN